MKNENDEMWGIFETKTNGGRPYRRNAPELTSVKEHLGELKVLLGDSNNASSDGLKDLYSVLEVSTEEEYTEWLAQHDYTTFYDLVYPAINRINKLNRELSGAVSEFRLLDEKNGNYFYTTASKSFVIGNKHSTTDFQEFSTFAEACRTWEKL